MKKQIYNLGVMLVYFYRNLFIFMIMPVIIVTKTYL